MFLLRRLLQILAFLGTLDIMCAVIPEYDAELCDDDMKIELDMSNPAARFKYNSNYRFDEICNVTIETVAGYHIAYKFQQRQYFTVPCYTKLFYDNGYSKDFYCANSYPISAMNTKRNTLELSIMDDRREAISLDIVLVSYHTGSCENSELRCDTILGQHYGCLNRHLMCYEMDNFHFCSNIKSSCTDVVTPTDKNTPVEIAVVVPFVVVLALFGVVCFTFYKRNECLFVSRNDRGEETVRNRAMNVFSVQFASRGVDGNDNNAFTDEHGETIDYSKFVPPPDYDSLENIDGTTGEGQTNDCVESQSSVKTNGATRGSRTNHREESTGNLPSYDAVMNNFDQFSVSTPI